VVFSKLNFIRTVLHDFNQLTNYYASGANYPNSGARITPKQGSIALGRKIDSSCSLCTLMYFVIPKTLKCQAGHKGHEALTKDTMTIYPGSAVGKISGLVLIQFVIICAISENCSQVAHGLHKRSLMESRTSYLESL
jgi:hypothetical protein